MTGRHIGRLRNSVKFHQTFSPGWFHLKVVELQYPNNRRKLKCSSVNSIWSRWICVTCVRATLNERGPRRVRRVDYARGSIKPRKLKPPVSTGNFFCNESMIFVPRIVPRRDSIFHFYCSSFVKKQNLFLTKSIIFNRFNALFSLNRIVEKFRVVFTISIKWQIHYLSSNIFTLCKYIC